MPVNTPSESQTPAKKRPLIQLPSLREVQSSEQARAPANQFRPSSAQTESTRAAQGPAASSSRAPVDPYSQGTGVFSPAHKGIPTAASSQYAASVPRPQQAAPTLHQQQALSGLRPQPAIPSSTPVRPAVQYTSTPARPAPPPQQVNPNAILVSKRQEGNPVLKHMRNVRFQFADIVPDYQMGGQTCALFLSLRYHLLKPQYIYGRIKELQRAYRLRVLLCHVDVDDAVDPLAQVTKAALLNDCTLFCAWSPLECARYLETLKSYESKPADLIQGRAEEDYMSKLNAALTTVRGVNRTDVLTLAGAFRTAAGVMRANMQELSALPGIGPTKVKRLHETFHEPFKKTMRHGALSFSPTQAAPRQAAQQAEQAGPSAEDAHALAASALAMPMESALEDPDEEQYNADLL